MAAISSSAALLVKLPSSPLLPPGCQPAARSPFASSRSNRAIDAPSAFGFSRRCHGGSSSSSSSKRVARNRRGRWQASLSSSSDLSPSKQKEALSDQPLLASPGDIVTVSFICSTETGELLFKSDDAEPLSFEVGVANAIGNQLFRDFDLAVRGLKEGDSKVVQSKTVAKDEDLIFEVPIGHEEVQRLREEAQARGERDLEEGVWVTLANGSPALVAEVSEDKIVFDANHPLVGKEIGFEVKVLQIERSN